MITYSVTELRQKTSAVISTALAQGYVHIIKNSKTPVAVVDSKYLATLQEAYEDAMDVQTADKHVNEPTISIEEYLEENKISLDEE